VRALLIPILGGLVVVALAIVAVAWLRDRDRRGRRDGIERVLAAVGPGRCVEAARLLRRLAERRDQAAIAAAWEPIELPLLQALPDCPPDYKVELISALDDCAKACRDRELAKRLVTMRNSLIA
jgi:hypothetical protein